MNFEVIINIVIVLVIIVSALKRVKQVSEKSEDIKKPPVRQPVAPERPQYPPVVARRQMSPVSPESWSEEGQQERQTPARSLIGKSAERKSLMRELLDEALITTYEDDEETLPEASEQPGESTTVRQKVRQLSTTEPGYESTPSGPWKESNDRGQPGMQLRFGSNTITRGIIMSEILGPPSALRSDRY